MRRPISVPPIALALAGVLALAGWSLPHADASDVADSPMTAARPSADLGDAYFFLDPNDNNYVVLAATLRAFIVPSENANLGFFDPTVVLKFEIENSLDAKTDERIEVKFSPRTSPTAPQTATIKLPSSSFTAPTTISRGAFGPPGAPTFGGGTSAQQLPAITTDSNSDVSFFGGLIDDPFFMDLGAVQAYLQSRLVNQTNPAILTRGRDGFAGYNTMAVVLRVPANDLKGKAGDLIGLSVSLKGSGGFKDRVGHPLVNSIFINYDRRVAYNAATTAQDAKGKFHDEIVAALQALQTDSTSIDIITNVVANRGDILYLSTALPNTGPEGGTNSDSRYPVGRRPNDDVVDARLTLINNRVFQGDAVNDNEYPLRNVFPFFAPPTQPFPPGGSEDLTRN